MSGCASFATRLSSPRIAAAKANAARRLPTPGGPCRRYACAGPSLSAASSSRFASGCSARTSKPMRDQLLVHELGEHLGRESAVEHDDSLRVVRRQPLIAARRARVEALIG